MECLEVTVPSKSVGLSLSLWATWYSYDDSASVFEVPPVTYDNLQGPGFTDRAGMQDTRQENTQNARSVLKAQDTAQFPQRCVHYKQPDDTIYPSRPAAILITITGGI